MSVTIRYILFLNDTCRIDVIFILLYNTGILEKGTTVMPSFMELNSEDDRLPDSLRERLMSSKYDVQIEVREYAYRLNTWCKLADNNLWHSIKYYSLLKDLVDNFLDKLDSTVLPHFYYEWWRYSYELSHKGVRLYLEHMNSAWLNKETGEADEETVDQVFQLIACDARMLTVDEYAKLYGVEPVTVRQWIRRGKLREAEKVGKEWRISELTDVPGRRNRYERAAYKWISQLTDIPGEFPFLSDYTNIEIREIEQGVDKANPGETYIAKLYSRAERYSGTEICLTTKAKDRLEAYLIANPNVLFTGNTSYYCYKHEDEDEEEEEEDESED